jgi:hypothetical protein
MHWGAPLETQQVPATIEETEELVLEINENNT